MVVEKPADSKVGWEVSESYKIDSEPRKMFRALPGCYIFQLSLYTFSVFGAVSCLLVTLEAFAFYLFIYLVLRESSLKCKSGWVGGKWEVGIEWLL